jgi:hypothetical protein
MGVDRCRSYAISSVREVPISCLDPPRNISSSLLSAFCISSGKGGDPFLRSHHCLDSSVEGVSDLLIWYPLLEEEYYELCMEVP